MRLVMAVPGRIRCFGGNCTFSAARFEIGMAARFEIAVSARFEISVAARFESEMNSA
jgi:hypothetical protein